MSPHIRRSRRASRDGASHPGTAPRIRRSRARSREVAAHPQTAPQIRRSRPASPDGAAHPEKSSQIRRHRRASPEVAADRATARRCPGIYGSVWRIWHVRRQGKRGERDGHGPALGELVCPSLRRTAVREAQTQGQRGIFTPPPRRSLCEAIMKRWLRCSPTCWTDTSEKSESLARKAGCEAGDGRKRPTGRLSFWVVREGGRG